MKVAKMSAAGLPALKKKPLFQQVMKPKDWLALSVLIVVSAVAWLWVLSAYQEPIDLDRIIISNGIDNSSVL